jgi:hypothetical protein
VLHLGGSIHKLEPDSAGNTEAIPAGLSEWDCFQSAEVESFSDKVIPYNINALLWTDFAHKERFMVIPNGSTVAIDAEGRFVFPPGGGILDLRMSTRLTTSCLCNKALLAGDLGLNNSVLLLIMQANCYR